MAHPVPKYGGDNVNIVVKAWFAPVISTVCSSVVQVLGGTGHAKGLDVGDNEGLVVGLEVGLLVGEVVGLVVGGVVGLCETRHG